MARLAGNSFHFRRFKRIFSIFGTFLRVQSILIVLNEIKLNKPNETKLCGNSLKKKVRKKYSEKKFLKQKCSEKIGISVANHNLITQFIDDGKIHSE